MQLKEEFAEAHVRWQSLTVYQKFEHVVILILTLLIAVVIVFAVWSLAVKILLSLLLLETFDLTDHAVFQAVFGMIFTVIIALEFKRSLLVAAERKRDRRASSRRDPDRDAGHRSQVDHSRPLDDQRAAAVRAGGGDPVARRGVLADQGAGQTWTLASSAWRGRGERLRTG